jgi:hypothetical protein
MQRNQRDNYLGNQSFEWRSRSTDMDVPNVPKSRFPYGSGEQKYAVKSRFVDGYLMCAFQEMDI